MDAKLRNVRLHAIGPEVINCPDCGRWLFKMRGESFDLAAHAAVSFSPFSLDDVQDGHVIDGFVGQVIEVVASEATCELWRCRFKRWRMTKKRR